MEECKAVGYRCIYFDAIKAGIKINDFIYLDGIQLKVTNVTSNYVRGKVVNNAK